MNNKVLVNLKVPEIDKSFDLFLPANKKIGNIILLINKTLSELTEGKYQINSIYALFNLDTKELYTSDQLLLNTNIRNGTRLLLLSKTS